MPGVPWIFNFSKNHWPYRKFSWIILLKLIKMTLSTNIFEKGVKYYKIALFRDKTIQLKRVFVISLSYIYQEFKYWARFQAMFIEKRYSIRGG